MVEYSFNYSDDKYSDMFCDLFSNIEDALKRYQLNYEKTYQNLSSDEIKNIICKAGDTITDIARSLNVRVKTKFTAIIVLYYCNIAEWFPCCIEDFIEKEYYKYKQYVENPTRCLYCNKALPYIDIKINDEKQFCNKSCATIYNNSKRPPRSEESRRKISEILLAKRKSVIGVCEACGNEFVRPYYKDGHLSKTKHCPECIEKHKHICNTSKENIKKKKKKTKRYISTYMNICEVCGKEFISLKNKHKACSEECRHILRSNTGKRVMNKRINSGEYKGWRKRIGPSYPEQYFMEVLENNHIEYDREFSFRPYFLDFYIIKNGHKIDLEIDGGQHNQEERHQSDIIRDEFLTQNEFIVYRIPWNNPKTAPGKIKMKEKIDAFLEFYNNL